MPVIRRYKVTQIRVVEVDANTPQDAARVGAFAFEHGQNSDFGVKNNYLASELDGVWGNTTKEIEIVGLAVEKL